MACLIAAYAGAQELEIATSPSPVGSGARAAGMADAFVAIADDATAASWNPAGLVQLEEPEISIVGSFNGIWERFSAEDRLGFDSTHTDNNIDLNYLSVVYPLPILVLGRNVSLALSYQRKYDFSRKFDLEYTASRQGNVLKYAHWRFEQDGGLSAVTPALAFELTPRLSLGVAVNLWRSTWFGENGWTQDTDRTVITLAGSTADVFSPVTREEYTDIHGENLTLGLLWNVTDKWNLGARYDSGFTAEADYKRVHSDLNRFPRQNVARGNFPVTFTEEERTLRFPTTVAFGVAYRRNDRLTLSTDVTRTDWNHFYVRAANGRKISLIDGSDLNNLPEDVGSWRNFQERSDFDPTYTVRCGTEYVFIPREPRETLNRLWTLRGGVFYDQEPATGHPDNFYGAAAGVGLLLRQRVNIDLAYQLRYGGGVNHDYLRGPSDFKEDVLQHRVLLSTVIYF